MGKSPKVRRYGYERKRKRQKRITSALVTILVVGVAAVVGWFAFDPVYQFIVNFEFAPSQSQSPGGDGSESDSSAAPIVPELPVEDTEAFPAAAAYLPSLMMSESNLAGQLAVLKAQGFDGVVFDLKDSSGMVKYQSGLALVTRNRAQAEDAFDLAGVIKTIRQAGMVPVGRLHAFEDHTAPAHMHESAVKYMGGPVNWIDNSQANGGRAWLNPADLAAQDYILDLMDEAASLGLTHIMFDGVQFPEGVSLQLATYGVTGELDKSAILAEFLTRAKERGGAADIAVWPTVNLLSATGISEVRYGNHVARLLAASGQGIIEVMPDQFGSGVTSGALTLSAPVLDPHQTVKTALAAAALDTNLQLVAMVQAYTATNLPAQVNKTYTRTEVEEQIKAVQEAGINMVLWYNPGGIYF